MRGFRIFLGLLLLVALAGCGHSNTILYEVAPSGYVVYGWYIGNQQGVRLWVSDLRHQSTSDKTVFAADVVVQNDRPDRISFDFKQNRLEFGNRDILVEDAFVKMVASGERKAFTLLFPSVLGAERMQQGTLHVEGIITSESKTLSFTIPIFRSERHDH